MRPSHLFAADNRRPLWVAVTATGAAAVVGNGFVGRDALAWFRSLRRPRGFVGTVAFTAPLAGLGVAVRHDPVSRRLVEVYAGWVAYDLWWSHRLWKLNP